MLRSLFLQASKRCPRCRCTDLSRQRRSILEKALSFGHDIRKYRCDKCLHVFLVKIKTSHERLAEEHS